MEEKRQPAPRVGVDVGGTFTDVVVSYGETLTFWKVPSTPRDQSEGFEQGVREALERAGASSGSPSAPSDRDRVLPSLIAHGTTVATNAVLERKGACCAFVATEGFTDLLLIGRQDRPSLYDLRIDRPDPLVPRSRCFAVPERTGPSGEVVRSLDEEALRALAGEIEATEAESVGICLLFSFANPAHEERVAEVLAKGLPGVRICQSSEVLPELREYERASTTVLDAYVGPVIQRYLSRLNARVADLGAPIVVMRSGGGTMSVETAEAEPVHTLLSGPAAGVRGAAVVGARAGFSDLVTFDMGGTSTDVCLVEGGQAAVSSDSSVGGLPFRTPSLAIHTAGAGGGSVLWLDEAGALRVGPRSAGASPGPACYGRGGLEPTVTDAHLVLGHLDPGARLGGRVELHTKAAIEALGALGRRLGATPEEVAAAGLAAVRAQMEKAIRVVTVERGRDPRDFALLAFGGAGPMHACALASGLGMETVLVPASAGVLSALGLLATPLAADVSLSRPMGEPEVREVEEVFGELVGRAEDGLRRQGSEPATLVRAVDCRYRGQAHEIRVPFESLEKLGAAFEAEHRARFGWHAPGEVIELVTFRVRATAEEPALSLPVLPRGEGARPQAMSRLWTGLGYVDAPRYRLTDLGWGDRIAGPCVVASGESTLLVEPGWEAEVGREATVVLTRREPEAG